MARERLPLERAAKKAKIKTRETSSVKREASLAARYASRFTLASSRAFLLPFAICLLLCPGAGWAARQEEHSQGKWISLFNGKDLAGWTPKITGYELGENPYNTFRVEDGLLKVSYDQYEKFGGKFGHIFYKTPFSHYRLRLEYRFVGEQVPGGPGWAFRNNGIMIHCQDPKTMAKGQNFPVSIEVQLLGGDGKNKRSTGNLCTPGTNVVMNDTLMRQHCINSNSETYHGDQWVKAEVEVHGDGVIRHIINGKIVLQYSEPQLDERDADAKKLLENGADRMLGEGYISLQAESHACEFRKIEILPLER